jgi:hypothetical protein
MLKRFKSFYRTYRADWRGILTHHDRRNIVLYDTLWVLTGRF